MREIFCRGKNRNDHKWIYGYYVKYCQDYEFIFQDDWIQETHKYKDNGNTTLKGAFEIIPETVGQYTGLTDKNGKKIFEGDILKCRTIDGYYAKFVVAWSDFRKYIIGCNSEESYDIAPSKFKEAEIIGNIHDNPKLLEVPT
jgi:uncharacterized phage protein (TIGR01671 family)